MKIFKLMTIALVAMVGLNSCSKDCGHDFIEYDYNEALVGTWTYLEEGQVPRRRTWRDRPLQGGVGA